MADRAQFADLVQIVAGPTAEEDRLLMARLYADLVLRQRAADGDRAPLELQTAIERAPDDDTRLLIALWGAEHGHDLLDIAAQRPEPLPGPTDEDWRAWQARRADVERFGIEDGTANPLRRWLHVRYVADNFMAKHPGAFVYNDAGIGKAHDALQAALDEAGPLALMRTAAAIGYGQTVINATDAGVSEAGCILLTAMALKTSLALVEEQAKALGSVAHLIALREVKALSDADRIPLVETRTAVLAALSGVALVRPLPEADRIAAELDAAARRAGQ
jgi:hypothetical protein